MRLEITQHRSIEAEHCKVQPRDRERREEDGIVRELSPVDDGLLGALAQLHPKNEKSSNHTRWALLWLDWGFSASSASRSLSFSQSGKALIRNCYPWRNQRLPLITRYRMGSTYISAQIAYRLPRRRRGRSPRNGRMRHL